MSVDATPSTSVPVVLVAGFWLGAWAWDDVVPGLRRAGLEPHALTLPGLESPDEARVGVTLEDHVRAVEQVVDALEGPVVLVGHSGGALVVQSVVDRHAETVRRVVYVDDGPMVDGFVAIPDMPDDAVDVPLPDWEALSADGASTEGIDEAGLALFRARAVPHPAGVVRSPVRLQDERRWAVPATVVCTSVPSTVLKELVDSGRLPTELHRCTDVEYVDLPTGHWPMLSRPADLAAAIVEAARR